MIVCADCGQEKPRLARGLCSTCYWHRYRQEHREERNAYRRHWRQANPEKCRGQKRRYYQKHSDKVLAHNRLYYEAHRDERLLQMKHYYLNWYQDNRERNIARIQQWRRKNPERAKATARRWEDANHIKRQGYWNARQARKRHSFCNLTAQDISKLLAIGQQLHPGEQLHLAHLVPLSKGGNTTRGNITVLPAMVNLKMGIKLPEEIYEQLSF